MIRAPHFQQSAVTPLPHRGHRVGAAVVEAPAEAHSHSGSPQITTKGEASRLGSTRFNGTPQPAQYDPAVSTTAVPHFQHSRTIRAPQAGQVSGSASVRGADADRVHSGFEQIAT